jgi:hypothetical protein
MNGSFPSSPPSFSSIEADSFAVALPSVTSSDEVTVSCTTKNYILGTPSVTVKDSTNQEASAKLDISYTGGKLTVATNDATVYGMTYKITLKANDYAPASVLTVSIPAKEKSDITATVKVSGKIEYLLRSFTDKKTVYRDILQLTAHENLVDLGAYDGDTIREFLAATGGEYDYITALEPDEKNFKKLLKNTEELFDITCLNMGAWDKKDTLIFAKKAS